MKWKGELKGNDGWKDGWKDERLILSRFRSRYFFLLFDYLDWTGLVLALDLAELGNLYC